MTVLKLDSKMNLAVQESLQDLRTKLYKNPGMKLVALVELAHVERTEVPEDEDKANSVKVGIKHIEVGRGEQEHALRRALDALHRQRTADGTLDEALLPQLDERTIELLGDQLDDAEGVRMRAAVKRWERHLLDMTRKPLTMSGLHSELDKVRSAMRSVLGHTEDEQ